MDLHELLLTAARALAVYVLMLIVIRALGKRTVGNLSGHITKIDPSGVVMDDTRALAQVRVRGTRADADVSVPMRREGGLWKVDGLPAIQEHHE